jgi:gliding motility-associated-like protein
LDINKSSHNQASNRATGPDGPLRIQVADPYFSPNSDGVKDSLNFKVIAETSEPYSVQVKRNGATLKSWAGLTGEQNLSWDGKQNGQALADGKYRIVA